MSDTTATSRTDSVTADAAKVAKAASAKAGAAKASATKAAREGFDAFAMATPNFELPPAFREMAEKVVENGKDGYQQIKAAGERTAEAFEDSYQTARDGALALGAKSLDAAQARGDATFAFLRDLMSAKSFSEALTLQASFARAQFESLAAEARDFGEASQKLATEAARPLQANAEKVFSSLKPH